MAVLRLFAAARDAAGTGRDEISAATVGGVLDVARDRYGSGFAEVLDRSRVWRNGEPAEPSEPVDDEDEVAVLPPVSGGAGDPAGGPPTRPVRIPRTGIPGARPEGEPGWTRRTVDRVRAPRPAVPPQVVVRGKSRPVAHHRSKRPLLGRRLAPVYDTTGPKITFGVVWFGLVVGGLVVGPVLLVPLYAVVAALAGFQTASAWRSQGSGADPWIAGLAAGVVVVGAAWGVASMGLAMVTVAVVALGVAAFEWKRVRPVLEAAGTTLQSSLPAAVAAAGVVLTLRLEIGAAVTLVVLVAAYEIGDYIVGSGASSSVEGPVAGIVAIAATCLVVAVLRVPPFDGAPVFVFGGFAAFGCPLGQVLASAVLPTVDAPARALRRLDSLLVLGPAWPILVGLLLQQVR